jgi:hypothetical protein
MTGAIKSKRRLVQIETGMSQRLEIGRSRVAKYQPFQRHRLPESLGKQIYDPGHALGACENKI